MEDGDGGDESGEVSWPLFSDLLKVVILSFLNEYVCNRNHIYLLLCSLQKLGANRCIFQYFSEIMKVHFSRRA